MGHLWYDDVKKNDWGMDMDFSLSLKKEKGGACYKLLRSNFYRERFVIIAQSRDDFACGSICAGLEEAREIFFEIAESETAPHTLLDILCDMQKQRV